jgi:hypothetical protein
MVGIELDEQLRQEVEGNEDRGLIQLLREVIAPS